jgi:hypothetical protein
MTKDGGKVSVTVAVPVFGPAAGAKTLAEIISGRPVSVPAQPSVLVEDLPATTKP